MSLRRFVALAGVILLAISFCGCGDTGNESKSPTKIDDGGPKTQKTLDNTNVREKGPDGTPLQIE